MDAEKLLNGYTSEEIREIAEALPPDVLRDAVANRGIEIPEALGAAAVEGEVASEAAQPATEADPAFQERVIQFLDVEARPSVNEQLACMGEFWGNLGHEIPELTEDQRAALEQSAKDHPDWRIVPAPLHHDLRNRKYIADTAATAYGTTFDAPLGYERDDEDGTYAFGHFLSNPETSLKDGYEYVLRYKDPNGDLKSRSEYMAALCEANQAVKTSDDVVWIFPIVDVSTHLGTFNPSGSNLEAFQESVIASTRPLAAPEAFQAVQLLHQIAGVSVKSRNHANEAIYPLANEGGIDPERFLDVTVVGWNDSGSDTSRGSSWNFGNVCGYISESFWSDWSGHDSIRGCKSGL